MTTKEHNFLNGAGEMAERTRAYNWAASPLGTPATWPAPLRTAVSILLNSRFPMFLLWGDDYIQFYNDAYRPSLGNDGKHPQALGQRGSECWQEAWDVLGHLLDQVRLGGEAVWKEDQPVPIYRNGQIEHTYWTFSYSPVLNEDGTVGGVLSTCFETTEKVNGLARLKENADELNFAIEATELGTWDLNPATGRFTANARLKDWFGLKPEDDIPLSLAVDVIAPGDRERVAAAIARATEFKHGGKYEEIYTIVHPHTGKRRIVLGKGRAWFGPGNTAYRFNGTLQDITEKTLADIAQKEVEAKLKNVSDTSPTGLWLSDAEGNVNYVNKTLTDWTGIAYDDLVGAGWLNAIAAEDREHAAAAFKKAIAGRTHYDTDFRINKADGSTIWCRAAGDPFYNEDGVYNGYAGFCMDIQDQKEVNIRLEESRQVMLNSFEESPVAIATITRHQLTFTMANKFYGELVGRKQIDIVNKPLLEALPELEGQGFDKLLEGVLETGTPFISKEVSVDLVRDGKLETLYVDLVYQPQFNTENYTTGILVVATDVTEQVISRKKLEESERFSRYIFYNSPVAKLVYTGEDMVLREANEAMFNIFGRDSSILNQPILDTIPELRETDLLKKYRRVLDTGDAHYEYGQPIRLVKNGESYQGYYDYIYKPLYNLRDEIYGVVCTAVDVSRETLSRQQIEAAETALRGAIELAELATWSIDIPNRTIRYSEKMQEWLGLTTSVLQIDDSPRVHPKDRQRVGEALRRAMEPGGNGHFNEVYTIIHAVTAQERIIHSNGRIKFDDAGNAVFVSGTARDVTLEQELQMALKTQVQQRTEELEMLNESLRRSNDELSQYAYIASHDLQEPLRKIRVFSDMLADEKDIHDRSKKYISRIQESAERMARLIKDLLELSSVSDAERTKAQVDLNDVLAEVNKDFDLLITEKNATLNIGPLPTINAVKLQMNQLFYNIISNALKFAKADVPPVIDLGCRIATPAEVNQHLRKPEPGSTYYNISITDNGIGFDPGYAEQIFQVFKRLHGRDSYAGSGIGLALCRRITINHGGYLYCESEPGKGTTFHILLPEKAGV